MTKILISLALFTLDASTFAQTTVNGLLSYYNRALVDDGSTGGPVINGGAPRAEPISLGGIQPSFPGADYAIGLFFKNADNSYSLANQPDGSSGIGAFRTTTTGDTPGTMTGPVTVAIIGHAAGTPATFQIRVWKSSEGAFDQATTRGSSGDYTISQLGGTTSAGGLIATPNLNGLGFRGFQLPEPSTYALGLAGLGALAMMRRRKA
jgi:MYXO-CTERM domain-containing protein